MKLIAKRITSFLIILLLLSKSTLGQQFFRMKADFSIKETLKDGKSSLTMGTVYFDKTSKLIVYEEKFPEKKTFVVTDTVVYEVSNNVIISKNRVVGSVQFSIFNLSVSSKLSNYGLDGNPFFKLTDVSKEDSMIISTWQPSTEKMKSLTGDVLISTVHKKLFGLVFYNNKGIILSKQFFEEYKNFGGFEFPGQITQINYIDDKEYYKITTYKNVVVNDMNENSIYNFTLPAQ